MHKFDWLGQALAIVTGVADGARASSSLAHYPHGPMGAPVIYPQQQGMPVYHNRAMWPFVTAYGLKAAAITGNVSVADAAYQSLMRGASLNLSNMENLEWLSGQPLLLDEKNPSLIGPVINSKRQLWSVGAYLGMVIGNVFGISATNDGIEIRPFITSRLRRETFGQSNSITLNKLRLRDKTITVTIELPPASSAEGYYSADKVKFAWRDLSADSIVDIKLGALVPGQQAIRRVSADPYSESSAVFAPREPEIANFTSGNGHVRFDIVAGKHSADTVYNVYRDGKLAAAGVTAGAWSDRGANSCYAVEAVFSASGNRSHHSASRCAGPAIDFAERDTIKVPAKGRYQLQVRYRNVANQINLGISGGVKWLAVKDISGRVLAQHVIQLPHSRNDIPWVYSTPLEATLPAGAYRLELSDFYNMSYLQSNSTFSAAGGADGASNKFDIDGVRLLRVK
jgi:hypothetical protein